MAQHDPFTVEDENKRRALITERYEERKKSDLRKVLSTTEGRRVLFRILNEGRIRSGCFDSNALTMAYNEGKRDIALFLENEIEATKPEAIEQMRSEASTDRLIQEAELYKAEKGEKNA